MAERPPKRRSATVPSIDSAYIQRHSSYSGPPHSRRREAIYHFNSSQSEVRNVLGSPSCDSDVTAQQSDSIKMSATLPSTHVIKKTRTGRISKAAKGLRVHNCEECGKTYTRAEHLRRHQQNHKPGGYPCDFADCRRSFCREDLLARHKLRYDDAYEGEIPSQPFSTMPSPALHSMQITNLFGIHIPSTSYPPFSDHHAVTSAGLAPSEPFVLQSSPSLGMHPANIVSAAEISPLTSTPFSMGRVAAGTGISTSTCWQSAPSSQSPVAFRSPIQDQRLDRAGPHPFYGVGRSTPAFYKGQASHAMSKPPRPTKTPAVHHPHNPVTRSGSLPTYTAEAYASAPVQMRNDGMTGIAQTYGHLINGQHLLPAVSSAPSSHMMSAVERDMHEQVNSALLDDFTDDGEGGFYMNAYWQLIHPLYPVVHQPSFDSERTRTLLRTAMLALGAHALRAKSATEDARLLHEQCVKLLKKRTSQKWHTFRVCDLQAVVLVEIFALFRSRRPALYISPWFMDAYRHALQSENSAELHATEVTRSEVSRTTTRTKHHLLLTCYVVSQTWATLFGRRRAIQPPVMGTQLAFPRKLASYHEDSWASDDLSMAMEPEKICQAIASVLNEAGPRRGHMDSFQSLVMITAIIDPDRDPHACSADKSKHINFALVRRAMEQSARCRMTWHILMLCKKTPVRALLAVAGESWILGEKLGSPEDYAALQVKTRNWAKGHPGSVDDYNTGETQVAIERAFHHAKQALEIHRNDPRTGLPFEEWAIYLAGLVVWARGYIASTQARQAKVLLNMRGPDIQAEVRDGRFDDHELEQSMLNLAKSGGNGSLPWATTRCVLWWIRGHIERVDVPHSCAMTSSAQDVLMKLVLQGDADGWFG